MRRERRRPMDLRRRVRFHHACLGSADDMRRGSRVTHMCNGRCSYLTWKALLVAANVSTGLVLAKIDVEGFEWRALPEMMLTSPRCQLPPQMALELHSGAPPDDATGRRVLPREFLKIRRANLTALAALLWSRGGYHLAARDDNPRSSGSQLLLVQRKDWRTRVDAPCLL